MRSPEWRENRVFIEKRYKDLEERLKLYYEGHFGFLFDYTFYNFQGEKAPILPTES